MADSPPAGHPPTGQPPTDQPPTDQPPADHPGSDQRPAEHLPADSDVDLHEPAQRAELRAAPWSVLGAIAAGGAIGASVRYGLGVAFPAAPAGFPWSTFAVNVSGCLLIGALMVWVTQPDAWRRRPAPRLARPFLGVGLLGGFTTFSTYVVEIQRLIGAGAAGTALVYLAGTVVAALPATWLGLAGTRWLLRGSRPLAGARS